MKRSVADAREEEREEETRRLGREELEARVGRGLYVAGMRRGGGR